MMIRRETDGERESDVPTDAGGDGRVEIAEIGRPFEVRSFMGAQQTKPRTVMQIGRRTRQADTPYGQVIRTERPREPLTAFRDIALDSTLRAAAQRYGTQEKRLALPLVLVNDDLRRKVRESRVGNLILFVVDGSGSMGAQKRMSAVKGGIFSLLLDAYQKRDQVGMILFRGREAQLVLPPTNSVDKAQKQLAKLPTGGRTPLAQGLALADTVLQRFGEKSYTPLLVVVSDGRANVPLHHGGQPLQEVVVLAHRLAERRVSALVLDCETGRRRLGLARPLAEALRGACLPLAELSAVEVARSVRGLVDKQPH